MGRKTKQNKLTSPEQLALVNPENLRLKQDFLQYLRSMKRSESSIKAYSHDLDVLFVWILENANNISFVELKKRQIVSFQSFMIDNGNSPARIRRVKATMSSLSNYIENILDDEYEGFRSIVRKVENPVNEPVREKTVVSDEQLEDLLNKLTELKQYDKACALALAMCSGRRKAELLRFRVSDFNDDNLVCDGALYKTGEKIRTKGFGDGKYIYCYTLSKKFRPYFDAWIKDREERGIKSEWLFPDRIHPEEQMNITTLNSWARTFSAMLGLDFYWHAMRHYFCTSLVKAGIPDGVIQSIVSWASADMVRVYTDIDADEQIGMYFSGGDISVAPQKTISDL